MQPVDPAAQQKRIPQQKPAIPQARRTGEPEPVERSEIGDDSPRLSEPPGEKLPSVWNFRSILLILLAIMLALGGLGIIVANRVYNKLAEPDRSTPSIVVRKYLQATFDQRNEVEANRFSCADSKDFASIKTLLADVKDREKRFSIHITISWDGVRETVDGNRATVTAVLRIQVPEDGASISESLQNWEFSLEKHSGWRVCDATRSS